MGTQNKKLPKRPKNTECINKLQLVLKMEKYAAVNMDDLQLSATVNMDDLQLNAANMDGLQPNAAC